MSAGEGENRKVKYLSIFGRNSTLKEGQISHILPFVHIGINENDNPKIK